MITEFIFNLSLIIISISVMLVVLRLIKGPTLPDRVIALDLITTSGIAFIAIFSIISETKTILDIGLIIGLVAFLATVGFASYLERRNKHE